MNSMWYALLWKEMREQRGKQVALLAATCLLLSTPWYAGSESRWNETIFGPVFVVVAPLVILAIPLSGMFLGAGIAASEQSQHTIDFLQSLPTSMRRVAVIKLLAAVVTVLLPCCVVVGFSFVWRWADVLPTGTAEDRIALELAVLSYGLVVISLLLWMAATGVNLKDEVQAGAVGLLVILACWAALGLITKGTGHETAFGRLSFAIAPGGVVMIFQQLVDRTHLREMGVEPPSVWPPIAAATLTHTALVAWYVTRFGRVNRSRRQAIETQTTYRAAIWLRPPRVRPWTAILWKQVRESLPLAALGAGTILCVAVAMATVVYRDGGGFGAGFAFSAGNTWLVAGFLVSIVAGIGLLMDDLRPDLHGFWRSRPIDVDQWFGVKFCVGLLLTILTMAVPTATIYSVGVALDGADAVLEGLDISDDRLLMLAILGLLAQVGAFSVAAAAMALTRQPVTAAIVAIMTAVGVLVFSEHYPPSGAGLAAFIVVCSMVATVGTWLAVRNNWGWKH
jgi:hypothetical protein